MKKNCNIFVIAVMIIALSILLTGSGCSRNKDGGQGAKVKEVEKAVSDLEEEQAQPAVSEAQEDDQCKQHRYYASPGESTSVTFETVIDGKTAKTVNAEEPEFKKRQLEERNYSATYVSRSVDSFTKPAPIWIVSHPMFGKREGKPNVSLLKVNDIVIASDGSGAGTIIGVQGARGAGAVGRLSREELTKKLGGKDTIRFVDAGDMNKSYDVTPERKTVDLEFYILSVSLSIEGPAEVGPTERKAYGEVAWKHKKVGFNVAYDRAKGKYVISGPATARDCIKEPSE